MEPTATDLAATVFLLYQPNQGVNLAILLLATPQLMVAVALWCALITLRLSRTPLRVAAMVLGPLLAFVLLIWDGVHGVTALTHAGTEQKHEFARTFLAHLVSAHHLSPVLRLFAKTAAGGTLDGVLAM